MGDLKQARKGWGNENEIPSREREKNERTRQRRERDGKEESRKDC